MPTSHKLYVPPLCLTYTLLPSLGGHHRECHVACAVHAAPTCTAGLPRRSVPHDVQHDRQLLVSLAGNNPGIGVRL